MSTAERIYEAAMRGAWLLHPVLARGEGKLARGIRGRRGVVERMEAWAASSRERSRPLVWFHAPSVGEGLQARAVLERLREERPESQIVYTYFSPSAERFARSVPADFADYLPLDTSGEVSRALDALEPSVIAFTKTEVWPVLAREAARRGVRLSLLSATLPRNSSRLSGLARPLLAPAFSRLDRLAAISAADAERFAALGVPAERRTVMGDARFDQVWQRASSIDPDSSLQRRLRADPRPTLVAGSTWPADEARLVPGVAALRGTAPLRLILVPHEPTEPHLAATESLLRREALSSVRLSQLEAEPGSEAERVDVLLVDRVGVLGELYAVAALAYVGGGYGSAGLHSVLEPAAFGVPVLIGPRHGNAREAAELVKAGGAFVAADAGELGRLVEGLVSGEDRRSLAGERAADYVRAGRGAADRGARVIAELLDRSG
jgi:3-deoxy-D-manno-octulosonic-acid transferase